MNRNRSEEIWNEDLIQLLRDEFPKYNVDKQHIFKDICQIEDNGEKKLKLNFAEQDIVIWEKENCIDVKQLSKSKPIKILRKDIIIPSIIVELKYNGVSTHDIALYSQYASEIKSIFPNCKYLFAMRYTRGTSEEKLLRNGKNFDNIIVFEETKSKSNIEKYQMGDFKNDLLVKTIQRPWKDLIDYIKTTLEKDNSFLK